MIKTNNGNDRDQDQIFKYHESQELDEDIIMDQIRHYKNAD